MQITEKTAYNWNISFRGLIDHFLYFVCVQPLLFTYTLVWLIAIFLCAIFPGQINFHHKHCVYTCIKCIWYICHWAFAISNITYTSQWIDLVKYLHLQTLPLMNIIFTKYAEMDTGNGWSWKEIQSHKTIHELVEWAKAGNISISGKKGATGGPTSTPPHVPTNVDPANFQIVNEFNSFNLQNIPPPVPPRWKHSETLLDEYHKVQHSCQWIFDGPMCHIKSGKVKTSKFLIWASPDGEDIYESFNLLSHQAANDIELVMQHFEEFCKPICNFRVARFCFTKVFQQQGETIDTFYNSILKLARQCEFSDINKRMIDAIIFGMNCIKAQDKLLQTPKMLSLQQCITVCKHYESLSLHIQQIRPDKHIEYLKKCHQKSKQNKAKPQQHGSAYRVFRRRLENMNNG